MAQKTKIREISIHESHGVFSILRRFGGKEEYDFKGLSEFRQILSNEKARILDVIKNQKPSSIYSLSKMLGRNFKSVQQDIKLLEKFGFIELVKEKTKNRIRHRPEIVVDTIIVNIRV